MAMLQILIGLLCVARLCTSQCQGVQEIDVQQPREVSSPSYGSGNYGSNLDCKYRLKAPDGHRIKLTFLDLDIAPSTSCASDRLEVHDKNSENVMSVFCGNFIPRPVLSHEDENELTLVFKTDSDTKGGKGFRIKAESGLNLELCDTNLGVCRNRNCYDVKKVCDGEDNCEDGTDEEDCDYTIPSVDCGETPIKPNTIHGFSPDRMKGGEPVVPNSWPWHASIQDAKVEPNGHFCGGTLIAAQWVLTASRCLLKFPNPKSIRVVLGSHRLFEKSKFEQVRYGERIVAYPDWEDEEIIETKDEDVFALIKLNAPVNFTDGVRPPCLPFSHWEIRAGAQCYTTGWGIKDDIFKDQLKQSAYEIKSVDHCSHDNETEICVENPVSAHCKDDTGSPLVCRLAGKYYLFGTSGIPAKENPETGVCSSLDSKLIFMKVASRSGWIRQQLEEW